MSRRFLTPSASAACALVLALSWCFPAAALAGGLSLDARSARPPSEDTRRDSVAALHREGEAAFEFGDYAGARDAWVDAYTRIEPNEDTWPYRATLLSLIVTAALAEFSQSGERSRLTEVGDMLARARAEPTLDDDVRAALDAEWERIEPYLDPTPPPTAVADEPSEAPAPVEQGPVDQPRHRLGPPQAWIGGGAAVFVGGVVAAVVGSRFEPRAAQQVRDAGDSTSESPGKAFIDRERSKGTGWIAAGSAVAVVGTAAIVTGVVLLLRERRRVRGQQARRR